MTPATAIPELPPVVSDEPRPERRLGVSLRTNFQWSMGGNIAYAACQWAILIVLAKFASVEAVGQFALGLALTAPIMLFANLQLGALLATDARREYRFGHYLALRLITTGLALAVIAGIPVLAEYSSVTETVVLIVGIAKAFEALGDVYHGLLQHHGRMDRIAWSQILKGTLSVAALGFWIWFGGGIIGAAVALALTWGTLVLCYDARSPAWLRAVEPGQYEDGAMPIWEWRVLGRLAMEALPLGIRVVLFTLCLNIPRYFVEQYHGEEMLGIFAAMAYVTVIAQVLANSLAQVAAPQLARHYAAGDMRGFRILTLKLVLVGALLGAGGMLLAVIAGRPILTLLYRPEYAEHVAVFAWIMLGSGLWCMATMFVCAANAARRQGSQAVAGVAVVAATFWASAALIGTDALTGAAAATVIGSAAALVTFGVIFLTIRSPNLQANGEGAA